MKTQPKQHGPFTYNEVMQNKIAYANELAQAEQRDNAKLCPKCGRDNALCPCEFFGWPKLTQSEQRDTPLQRLRHHVTGAIERGEKTPIVEQRDKRNAFVEKYGVTGGTLESRAEQRDTATRPQTYNAGKLGRVTIPEPDETDNPEWIRIEVARNLQAQAERLAEALRRTFTEYKRGKCEIDASVCIEAREALAAWEGAQK